MNYNYVFSTRRNGITSQLETLIENNLLHRSNVIELHGDRARFKARDLKEGDIYFITDDFKYSREKIEVFNSIIEEIHDRKYQNNLNFFMVNQFNCHNGHEHRVVSEFLEGKLKDLLTSEYIYKCNSNFLISDLKKHRDENPYDLSTKNLNFFTLEFVKNSMVSKFKFDNYMDNRNLVSYEFELSNRGIYRYDWEDFILYDNLLKSFPNKDDNTIYTHFLTNKKNTFYEGFPEPKYVPYLF